MNNYKWRNKWRERHRKLGLCLDCNTPAVPGYVYCPYHQAKARERSRRWKEKHYEEFLEKERQRKRQRRLEGKCPSCGAPLPKDWDRIYCANCIGRHFYGGYRFGAYPAPTSSQSQSFYVR